MHVNRASLQRQRSARLNAGRGSVLILCPGGLENGGGIGRQMGYFLSALDLYASALSYSVADSRGPWFLGAARFRSVMSIGYLCTCLARLVAVRLSRSPVIVHINITGRGSTIRKLLLVTAAQAVGLRYLLHVHDYDYLADYAGRGRILKKIVRRMFQRAERVIVLGNRDKENLQTALHLAPSKTLVMHNAVPDPRPNHAYGVVNERLNLLFLGHLSERKGVPELLRALGSPELGSLNWHATLAGGGNIETYRNMARSLNIEDRIDFPGWLDQPNVKAALLKAEILVLPSHAEGLAMAVLEGLSHGLAVITTPVGAHAEVIEDGISGLLLPPGDAKSLAQALYRVITDRDLRRTLQLGARERFIGNFEIMAYAERLAGLHADLLADRG